MPPPDQSAVTDPSTDPPAHPITAPATDAPANPDAGLGTLQLLRPLTVELVGEALAAEGWSYDIDDDGDLFGVWEGIPVFFRAANQSILQITSFTRIEPPPAEPTELFEFCNEWNQDRLWPKAYVRIEENPGGDAEGSDPDGAEQAGAGVAVLVYGEATTNLPHGVTLDQLRQLVRCGVGTSYQLAAALAARNG